MRLAADGVRHGESVDLVLADIDGDGLGLVAEELAGIGVKATPIVVDLAVPDEVESLVEIASRELGSLDALLSNAGIASPAALHAMSVDQWDRTFAVNVRATWLLAKHAYPLLREARGALVATASVAGLHPAAPEGAYSASKAALIMLIRQLAYEWGPDGIRCNCVSPGPTHTGINDAVYSIPSEKARRAQQVPLRRIASPDDVASVIGFLVNQDAGFVTGENVVVDGGWRTALMPIARNKSAVSKAD